MPNDVQIARRVKELVAEQAPYSVIRGVIKGSYGVDLTEPAILRYNSMPTAEPVVGEDYESATWHGAEPEGPWLIPEHVKQNYRPTTEAPVSNTKNRSFWQEVKSTLRFMGTGALVGTVLGGGLLFYVVDKELDKQNARLARDQSFASVPAKEAGKFSSYTLFKNKGYYILDSDGDKKPDTLANDSMLRAADNIIALGGDIDPILLIQSLYDTSAGNFTVRSGNQIIANDGTAQAAVYRLDGSRLVVNQEVNDTLQQILGALRNNDTNSSRADALARMYQTNPQATAMAFDAIGGSDFRSRLERDYGRAVTEEFSRMVRGNFSNAAASAVTLNPAGVAGNLALALINTHVAGTMIQNIEAEKQRSSGGSSDDYRCAPTGQRLVTVVEDGVTYQFWSKGKAEGC